jgi:hypothetical protein
MSTTRTTRLEEICTVLADRTPGGIDVAIEEALLLVALGMWASFMQAAKGLGIFRVALRQCLGRRERWTPLAKGDE